MDMSRVIRVLTIDSENISIGTQLNRYRTKKGQLSAVSVTPFQKNDQADE